VHSRHARVVDDDVAAAVTAERRAALEQQDAPFGSSQNEGGLPSVAGGGRYFRHVRREAVAHAVVGLDNPRLFRIVAKRRAHVANQDCEVGVGDERIRPHALDQHVLGDDLWTFIKEHQQQIECLARQPLFGAITQDLPAIAIDFAPANAQNHAGV